MAVLKDILDNPTGRFTFDGWTLERTAVVTGVTGSGHTKILNAMNTAGIPALGDQHPSGADCYLREAIPTADSSDIVRIRLVYADPANMSHRQQLDTIEVGGTLSQISTNKDRFGAIMYTSYDYPADYEYGDDLAGKTIDQGGLASIFTPEHTKIKSRLEYSDPSTTAEDFVGAVNTAGWNLAPSALVGTWLCTGILGRSNDGGMSFVVTYSFQYRADSWATEIIFIDPRTGKPPDDLVADTGYKSYEHYNIMNFNYLGL